MKIVDGIKLEGHCIEIPNSNRDELALYFKDLGYKEGAEIGVESGKYTEVLCKAGMKMHAIDYWSPYDGYYRPEPQEPAYITAQRRLAPYNVNFIKKYSMDAVKDFKDDSLDFVYIDANHTFPYVVNDIWEWEKKVKIGGVISGHDYMILRDKNTRYGCCHVKHAVDMIAGIMKVKKYYILGVRYPDKSGFRDRARSWFWVKQ